MPGYVRYYDLEDREADQLRHDKFAYTDEYAVALADWLADQEDFFRDTRAYENAFVDWLEGRE